jgi:hypothetical protein
MDQRQTHQLLIRASAIDDRTVTDTDVAIWLELLGHIDYDDLVDALRVHQLGSPFKVTPAHLVKILDDQREARRLTQQAAPTMCHIHTGYVIDSTTGACAQCVRHPEDLAPGAPAPELITFTPSALTAGHTPEEI